MLKVKKRTGVVLLGAAVVLLVYAISVNWKCRAVIKNGMLTGIKNGIAEKKTDLKKFRIPEGIAGIYPLAFKDCVNLESVSISDSVTEIGMGAFCNCTKLESIALPDQLKSIGISAFSGCTALQSITIPKGVEVIASQVFSDCSSLESISLPDTIQEIGESAFSNCVSLRSIDLPDNLERLGSQAFDDCSILSNVEMPEGIQEVGENPFSGTALMDSSGADEYGSVYWGDILLHNKGEHDFVEVRVSTTVIAAAAFRNNDKIKRVDLPEGIAEIPENCFQNCSSLEEVNISDGLQTIGMGAFSGSGVRHIKLPNGVTKIGYGAFYNCQHLMDINLPESIESVSYDSFENTWFLKHIEADEYGCKYAEGILLGYTGEGITKVKIKDGTRAIAGEAFENAENIKEVFIPRSVKTMGASTFLLCFNLEQVVFEEGIQIKKIESFTFAGCKSLEKINLPKSLKWIGCYAFTRCVFESITIPEHVEHLDLFAIRECYSLKEIVLPKRLEGQYYWVEAYKEKTPKLTFYCISP